MLAILIKDVVVIFIQIVTHFSALSRRYSMDDSRLTRNMVLSTYQRIKMADPELASDIKGCFSVAYNSLKKKKVQWEVPSKDSFPQDHYQNLAAVYNHRYVTTVLILPLRPKRSPKTSGSSRLLDSLRFGLSASTG